MKYKDLIFDINKYSLCEYDSITEDYSGRKGGRMDFRRSVLFCLLSRYEWMMC